MCISTCTRYTCAVFQPKLVLFFRVAVTQTHCIGSKQNLEILFFYDQMHFATYINDYSS